MPVILAGNAEQKKKYLGRMMEETLMCVCIHFIFWCWFYIYDFFFSCCCGTSL